MEFFGILVVVIILFNLIGSLTRREKDGQARPQKQPGPADLSGAAGLGRVLRELGLPVPPASPAPGGEPVFPVPPPPRPVRPPEQRSVYRRERPQPAPAEPAWAGEGKTLMWREEGTGRPAGKSGLELDRAGLDSALAPEAAAVLPDLVEMLRQKDRLVAGFIFHELLERPRSLRRR